MKSMLHEIRGNILVSAQGDVPVDDADWDAYLATVQRAAGTVTAFLISADNQGPNAGQRAKLADNRAVFPLPKAVVTTSMAVRGIVTATSWLGTNIRAFAPSQIDQAFDYLGVDGDARPALLELVARLKTRLAGSETWASLRPPHGEDPADLHLMQTLVKERVTNIRAKLRAAQRR